MSAMWLIVAAGSDDDPAAGSAPVDRRRYRLPVVVAAGLALAVGART